jgi:hypothetical protein
MNYLDKYRRNRVKRALRLQKPYLMGALLNQEVDRVLGIADSGKMDWVSLIESGKEVSDYPTPDSVISLIPEMAKKYQTKNYLVYWFFKKKINSLESSGRFKSNYKAVLEESARKAAESHLSEDARAVALVLFSADVRKQELSSMLAKIMIEENKV